MILKLGCRAWCSWCWKNIDSKGKKKDMTNFDYFSAKVIFSHWIDNTELCLNIKL